MQDGSRKQTSEQIDSLTGLRMVAALGVFFTHFLSRTALGDWGAAEACKAPIVRLLTRGFVGVPLFFTLSGFVLTCSTAKELPVPGPARSRFWVARFARIYPAYAFSLIVALPMLAEGVERYRVKFGPTKGLAFAGAAAGMVVTLVQSWFPRAANFWNGCAWSLSVEAFFYALFPFVICSPLLRSGGRREPWSFVVLAVAAVFVPTAVDLAYRGDVGESMRGFVVYPPVLHVPTFLMGIALGRRYLRRRSTPAGGAARPGGGALAAVSAALVVAILAAVPTIPDELLDYYSVPFFAVLIYGLAMGGGVLGRFLAWKPMVLLGEASYSFYLLHVPVSLLVARALGVEANAYGSRAGAALLRPWQTTLCLLTACAASVATLVFLERPARAYIRRAYAGRVARGTAQEA